MIALVSELTLQLSEIRKDYMALKEEIKSQNSRISNIEQHLSGSNTPNGSPMEISPINPSSSVIPPEHTFPEGSQESSNAQHVNYDEKLERIDNRYNSMESMLNKVVNMLSGFSNRYDDSHTQQE